MTARNFIPFFSTVAFISLSILLHAQHQIIINLPNIEIKGDKLMHGDADTYGRGIWKCEVNAKIVGDSILIAGSILFAENEADRTLIKGDFKKLLFCPSLQKFQNCHHEPDEINGSVGGPNYGAREPLWIKGNGLIHKIKIRTDTFGEDVGKIGGVLHFNPMILNIECLFAGILK